MLNNIFLVSSFQNKNGAFFILDKIFTRKDPLHYFQDIHKEFQALKEKHFFYKKNPSFLEHGFKITQSIRTNSSLNMILYN